jgi:hypothetical protein
MNGSTVPLAIFVPELVYCLESTHRLGTPQRFRRLISRKQKPRLPL